MADLRQCDNCGAVLDKEDVFCGECGAPNPSLAEASEPVATEPRAAPDADTGVEPLPDAPPEPDPDASTEPLPDVLPAPPLSPAAPPKPPTSAETGWRVAFAVLLIVGILACLAGVLGFVLSGVIGGDTTTKQEDWLIGALCCLLPIGGTGALLAVVGAVIWYSRLRSR